MPVGSLNDDSFRLDMKLGKFLLLGMVVVVVIVIAWIHTDLDLGIKARVDLSCGVEAISWELKGGHIGSSRGFSHCMRVGAGRKSVNRDRSPQ